MTRKEQLEFCKICQKQKFDLKKGIVCSITNEQATFENECPNFELDDKIKALETYKKDIEIEKKQKQSKPKIKKYKIRIKEQFIEEDWFLLLGFALLGTFMMRLIIYANFNYSSSGISLYFYLVVFIVTIVAVLIRKSKQDRNWFFSDIKFKLLLASLVAVFNLIYVLTIYGNDGYLLSQFIVLVVIFALLSVLSSLLIIPINFIIKKK